MRKYIEWHEANGRFYEGYESDKTFATWLHAKQYIYGGLGILFMGTVFNPTYTSPKSYYLRKINLFIGFYFAFQYGRKCRLDHHADMLLKMYDYLPTEVKRALDTYDYRHLALFDWENPGR